MKKSIVVMILSGLLLCVTTQAGLTPLVNPGFEDPALAAEATSNDINDWFDAVGYTYTQDEADESYPDDPTGENWVELGNGRWLYQQIGTYDANMDLIITLQLGDRDNQLFGESVTVELFAGGDAGLAEDFDAKRDAAEFPLDSVVGATQIASLVIPDPFADSGGATAEAMEVTIYLSTGTSGTVGEPLWLLISRPSAKGRALIGNVSVTLPNKAQNPEPTSGQADVDINLSLQTVPGELSWAAPSTYTGAEYDIYFGETEPNFLEEDYNLPLLNPAAPQTATSIAPPLPLENSELLENPKSYYWVVDTYEPNALSDTGFDLHRGSSWSFTTVTASPVIMTQPISQLADAGGDVTLSIDGMNFEDGDVTWHHISADGTDRIVGSASKTLVLMAVTSADEGQYYAVAETNAQATSENAYVMTKRLVARYDFEGDMIDTQGTLNAGVIIDPNEMDPNIPSIGYGDGIVGTSALLLEDTDTAGYIEVPGSEGATAFHSLGMTVSAWIKTTSSGTTHSTIVSGKDDADGSNDFLLNRYYARGRWKINNETVVDSPAPPDGPTVNDDQWHLLTGVYDDSTQERKLYIDGIHIGILTGDVSDNFTSQAVIRIGGWGTTEAGNTERAFLGLIDDVRIYSYPRTSQEIAGDYYDVTGVAPCYNQDFEGKYFDVAGGELDTEGNPTGDCQIDLADFAEFAAVWLKTGLYQP